MGALSKTLAGLVVLVVLIAGPWAVAQEAEPVIRPEPLPDLVERGNTYEAGTRIRTGYQEALGRWRYTRRQAELRDSGFCDDPANWDQRDYSTYCEPGDVQAAMTATIITRTAAPFMAQILFSDQADREFDLASLAPDLQPWERRHVCGGSLVATDWVLTAAHCFKFDRAELYRVRLDVSDLSTEASETIPVERIVMHPDYREGNSFNDIALVKLDTSGVSLALQPQPSGAQDVSGIRIGRADILDSATQVDDRTLFIESRGERYWIDLRTATRTRLDASPPDGQFDAHLAGPGYVALRNDRDILLYSGRWSAPARLTFDQDIKDFAYDPDGRQLSVLGMDGRLALFDTRLRLVAESQVPRTALDIAALGEGRVRMRMEYPVGWQDWKIGEGAAHDGIRTFVYGPDPRAFHAFPGQPHITIDSRPNGASFNRFLFPASDHLLEYSEGEITLVRGNRVRRMQTSMFPAKLSLHPSGDYVVALGEDANNPNGAWGGEVFDVRKGGVVWSFRTEPHFMDSNVVFIEGGQRFVLWDSEGRTQVREFRAGADAVDLPHSAALTHAEIIGRDRSLARTNIGTVEIADLQEGQIVARLHHGSYLSATGVYEETLMTWSRDGRIRLWDVRDGTLTLDYHLRDDGDLSSRSRDGLTAIPAVSLVHLSATRPQDPGVNLETVQVFGWGKTTKSASAPPSTELRMIGMSPIDWDRCIALQPPTRQQAADALRTGLAPPPRDEMRDPNAFCARAPARKSCTGDSGGPVLHDGYLIGVVSRGSVCKADDRPSTYTSVASFGSWIAQTVCPTQAATNDPLAIDFPSFCLTADGP